MDGEQLRILAHTDSLSFIDRNFRGLSNGSMRSVIITWIRMSLGIGILILPKYTQFVGIIPSILFIILGGFVNYKTYKFIFEAAYYSKIFNYFDLIEFLLGKPMRAFFNVTYFLDMGSTVTIYAIVTWRLFIYILIYMDLINEAWILDKNNITLNDDQGGQVFY